MYLETNTTYEELIKKDNWMIFDQSNTEITSGKKRKEVRIYWERDKKRIKKAMKDLKKILNQGTITNEDFNKIRKGFEQFGGLGRGLGEKVTMRVRSYFKYTKDFEILFRNEWGRGDFYENEQTGFELCMAYKRKQAISCNASGPKRN